MHIVIRSTYRKTLWVFYTFDFFKLTVSISDGRVYDLKFSSSHYHLSCEDFIAVNRMDKDDTFSSTIDSTPNEIVKSLDEFQKGKLKIHSTYSVRLRGELVGSLVHGRKRNIWFTPVWGYVKYGGQIISSFGDNWERYTGKSMGTFSKGTAESRKLVPSTAPHPLLTWSGISDFHIQCDDRKEEEIQAITLGATYLRDLYYTY